MALKMSKIMHFFLVYHFPDKNYTRTIRILYHPGATCTQVWEGDKIFELNLSTITIIFWITTGED